MPGWGWVFVHVSGWALRNVTFLVGTGQAAPLSFPVIPSTTPSLFERAECKLTEWGWFGPVIYSLGLGYSQVPVPTSHKQKGFRLGSHLSIRGGSRFGWTMQFRARWQVILFEIASRTLKIHPPSHWVIEPQNFSKIPDSLGLIPLTWLKSA